MVGGVRDVITCAEFQIEIFMGYNFITGRIFDFPIDFSMGLTTVQRQCAACDGNRLQVVSEERDLGVIMSEGLQWEKQCVAAVKQRNKILGMIKRNFTDRSEETIMSLNLCESLVRPHLEFCTPVWSPHCARH